MGLADGDMGTLDLRTLCLRRIRLYRATTCHSYHGLVVVSFANSGTTSPPSHGEDTDTFATFLKHTSLIQLKFPLGKCPNACLAFLYVLFIIREIILVSIHAQV